MEPQRGGTAPSGETAPTPGVFARLGRLVVYRRRYVLGLVVAFVAISAVGGGDVEERLSAGGFFDSSSESATADRLLDEQFGSTAPNVVLLVTPVDGFVTTPANRAAGLALTERLRGEPGVRDVDSFWTVEVSSPHVLHPLSDRHGRSGLILATITGDENEAVEAVGELAARYNGTVDGLEVLVGGPTEVARQVRQQARADLVDAELTMAPFTASALLIVFAGLVAAFLPLAVAVVAVVGTFLVLTFVSGQTEVSIFARVLTTALGVGLGIDYSLFVVSRFREELVGGQSVAGAVHRTVDTAGRTVMVSAGTVAVSLSALFLFPIAYLRSFAFAGVAVVLLAAVTAVVALPAMLAVLGGRVNAISFRRDRPAGHRFWYRQARRVTRRPLSIGVVVALGLVLLGLPFLAIRTSRVDDRVLPDGASSRTVSEALRADFSAAELAPVTVVAPDFDPVRGDRDALHSYALALAGLDGVERVVSEDGAYFFHPLAEEVIGPSPVSTAAELANEHGTRLTILLGEEPISPEGEAVITAIRSLPTGSIGDVLVTGDSARLVDTKAAVFGRLPIALVVIAVATLVLLWVMADSVLVPVKALALNLLSLTATFGALVWVFQEGHLAGLLDFTPTGSIDVFTPIIMFCVAFGLSMDYEVFVLSRIKEVYDTTGDNDLAVARGLEQTGGIVTAAALLLAMVFGAFILSDVSVVKMLGFGLALAVLVDAFLVRATLMPAFMVAAGRANWWSPPFLRRAHHRLVG